MIWKKSTEHSGNWSDWINEFDSPDKILGQVNEHENFCFKILKQKCLAIQALDNDELSMLTASVERIIDYLEDQGFPMCQEEENNDSSN